jgi:uncharacterized protein
MGATVVITHRVRDGRQGEYENWMNEIGPLCRSAPGNLDWQIIRPVPGFSSTYTVIIQFDTIAHLRAWTESPVRSRLIERVKPLLASGDDFFVRSGLDFWFAPTEAKTKVPARDPKRAVANGDSGRRDRPCHADPVCGPNMGAALIGRV